jgi:peptidoglycan/LPS O-acetylase OafA/YrhL
MPELDTLRAIAVLAVLLYHGFYWAQWKIPGPAGAFVRATEPGWVGVDLFFTLSGFLITGILLDSRENPAYFRNFYVRRVLRIWPAYFGLIGLLVLTSEIGLPFLVVSTFFLANLSPMLGVTMQYGPLWSLAVEEQFYLVWPLLARCAPRAALAGAAAAILVAGPVLRYLAFLSVGPSWVFTGVDHYTWLRLDGLAMGALLAIFLRTSAGSRRSLALLLAALTAGAAALVLLAGRFGGIARTSPLGAALLLSILSLGATVLLGAFLLLGTSRFRAVVNLPPLRFLGDISYGLYLVHLLAFTGYDQAAAAFAPGLIGGRTSFGLLLLRFLVATTAATSLAALSRRHYEEWFLRLKSRLAPAAAAAPGLTIPRPVAAAAPAEAARERAS